MIEDLPKVYKYWPDFARDIYNERVCIMRDGNNIPPDEQTPLAIRTVALQEAEAEIELARKKQ